jgi:tRNA pseudouridine(38-40) synthase
VQGVLQANLAKVYGKVPMERVVVEGCSRTDKGVHARFMVAQIYCLSEEATVAQKDDGDGVFLDDEASSSSSLSLSIPGKRKPHPRNCTDATCFVPVPKQQTTTPPSNNRLSDLGFTLNRMLPPDIRVMRIAPTPTITTVPLADNQHHEDDAAAACLVPVPAVIPFHPTLSCTNKTYQYQFSVGGHVQDPTQRRFTLQLKQSSREIISHDDDLLLARMRQAADCLQGRHNFAAFSGAPRGSDDRRKRREENPEDTICHIFQIDIEHVSPLSLSTTWKQQPTDTYRISICGNRFLYKMARFIVGAIISVGLGKVQVGDLEQALMRGKRRGPQDVPFYCAPPDFLILHEVQYNVPIEWQSVSN